MERTILHVDANCFYASVECLYNPEIRNKPVAVVGDIEKRHGIVLTANYIAKKYNVKTIVSMNPIMIDGTGMCGGCRLTVGGETKFACIDGPDFDGHLIDFDEAIERSSMYKDFEMNKREENCNLLKKEIN